MKMAWFVVLLSVFGALGCRSEEPLPQYGEVPKFELRDQDDRPFSQQSLRGKVSAVAFMFTRCPTICPAVTRAMKGVQEDARRRGVQLHLVSVSVDPENDTPAVLRSYASKFGADLSSWSFVTGDQKVVLRTAEEGFKIAASGTADPSKEHLGITHGTHLVLVDDKLAIRGYYASSDPKALERLVDDAARLAL